MKRHNYYYQVQHEIACTETTYCYFVVWTLLEALIVLVEKDFLKSKKCDQFWLNLILPELHTRKLETESTSKDSQSDSPTNSRANPNYCIAE